MSFVQKWKITRAASLIAIAAFLTTIITTGELLPTTAFLAVAFAGFAQAHLKVTQTNKGRDD